MDASVFENFSDQELLDTALYRGIISLLSEVKLVYGPEGLNNTLRRHNRIKLFLYDYQKKYIIDLESKIDTNNHCISDQS